MDEIDIKEWINITDEEIAEIAYWLVAKGADDNIDLIGLAKEAEKHVKSNEGLKFLYFILGKIETFERIFELESIYYEMDAGDLVKSEFSNFMKMLTDKFKEYKGVENGKR